MKIRFEAFDEMGRDHRVTIDGKEFEAVWKIDKETTLDMARYKLETGEYPEFEFVNASERVQEVAKSLFISEIDNHVKKLSK